MCDFQVRPLGGIFCVPVRLRGFHLQDDGVFEVEGLLEVISVGMAFVRSIPWDLLCDLHSKGLICDVRCTSQAGAELVCLKHCKIVAHLPGPGAERGDPLPRLKGKKEISICMKCFLIEGCP